MDVANRVENRTTNTDTRISRNSKCLIVIGCVTQTVICIGTAIILFKLVIFHPEGPRVKNTQQTTVSHVKDLLSDNGIGPSVIYLTDPPTSAVLGFDLNTIFQEGSTYSLQIQIAYRESLCKRIILPRQGRLYACLWKDDKKVKWDDEEFRQSQIGYWIKNINITVEDLAISGKSNWEVTSNNWDCIDHTSTFMKYERKS